MPAAASDRKLLSRVAKLLDALGPFPEGATREEKWRTTEQLANELGLFGRDAVDGLDDALRRHEAEGLERLDRGEAPCRDVRRAKYPDRTTALPLWGSTRHHGQPWKGQRPERVDPAEDMPSSLVVAEAAPHVFLSHTGDDASKALDLAAALAGIGIGCWRFETHIEQRGDIADCVRRAIAEADAVVALVTRTSIVSLWVLTELHTALEAKKAVALVVDASDAELLGLLESARFPHPDGDFDISVTYDPHAVEVLKRDYARRQSRSRTDRYEAQLHDFMATLPLYLGSVGSDGHRVWRPALAFPQVPQGWSAFIGLDSLDALGARLPRRRNPPPRPSFPDEQED